MRAIDSGVLQDNLTDIYGDENRLVYLKDVLDLIDEQPTLTPPNEWVSVEDRLPQLRENVLVCAYWHEHWGVYIGWNNGHGWTVSCGIGQRNDVQVSHWMPLPAPPDKGNNVLAKTPNEPLTLEQLREIDGEPVYIHSDIFPEDCGWRVIARADVLRIYFTDRTSLSLTDYGKSWIAYRRPPERGG